MAENKQYISLYQENGAIIIAEDVLVSSATVAVNETEGVSGLNTKLGADISDILNKKNRGKGVKITITEEDKLLIECNIIVTYGSAVVSVAKAVQDNVTAAVESMTGITPAEINVNICGITVEQK